MSGPNTPECPRCGSNQTEIIKDCQPGSWFMTGKAVCEFCGTQFSFRFTLEDSKSEAAE
jgi:transcription elongation factor Elf1